jgi:uncharacterized protein (DUF433 family)
MNKQLITISPEIQSGTPVFYNTRVPVKNLFDYLKAGDTLEEFLDDFPSVSKQQAVEVLQMAENILTFNHLGDEATAR